MKRYDNIENSYDTKRIPNIMKSNSSRLILSREASAYETSQIIPQISTEKNADKYLKQSNDYVNKLNDSIIRNMMHSEM